MRGEPIRVSQKDHVTETRRTTFIHRFAPRSFFCSQHVYSTLSCTFTCKIRIKSPDVWLVLVFPSSYPAQLRIDPSSPTRKRRRMSSPTYDDQLAFPNQDELKVIGQFEISLSQAPSRYRESASIVPGMGTSSQNSFGLEVCIAIHTRFTTPR
jgi:hypothetical protein